MSLIKAINGFSQHAYSIGYAAVAFVKRFDVTFRPPRRWFLADSEHKVKRASEDVERRCEKEATAIDERVFISGACFASSRTSLRQHGITHIINATKEIPRWFSGDSTLELPTNVVVRRLVHQMHMRTSMRNCMRLWKMHLIVQPHRHRVLSALRSGTGRAAPPLSYTTSAKSTS